LVIEYNRGVDLRKNVSQDQDQDEGQLNIGILTCIVTNLSSTITSLVKKSAPMVALYWLLNFLFTYWFIKEVFPTLNGLKSVSQCAYEKETCSYPLSPRMMTFNNTFFLDDIVDVYLVTEDEDVSKHIKKLTSTQQQ
jgi:hypothetical protein